MEKIKIGLQEFDLVPMGITDDTQRKTRSYKFTSLLSYLDVITVVSGAVTSILHIGGDGNIIKTYSDIVAFKGLGFEKDLSIEDGVTTDVYTVTYSIDAVEKEIQRMNEKINNTQTLSDNAVAELTILIATLYSLLA